MKQLITLVCAAMATLSVAAQTVDGTPNTATTTPPTAKQLKAQKVAELKAFKAKQKAELQDFIARQNSPTQPSQPPQIEKPELITAGDTLAYLFGSFQANGLKAYLQGQLNVDTTLYMNEFFRGLTERANVDPKDQAAHAFQAGTQIGNQVINLASQITKDFYAGMTDETISPSIIANAIIAALTGQNEYTTTEAQELFSTALNQRQAQNAEKLRQPGQTWLAENAKKEGVVVLPSGLQYKVLTMGTGPKPTATQQVTVNYEGRLTNGTVFDSSYTRGQPTKFAVKDVIRGWTEILQLMPTGSKWEVYIPENMAYGDRDTGTIPPYSTLIFTIELLDVE